MKNYLDNYAQKMRAEAIEKFGDKFSATRRIMTVFKEFNKN